MELDYVSIKDVYYNIFTLPKWNYNNTYNNEGIVTKLNYAMIRNIFKWWNYILQHYRITISHGQRFSHYTLVYTV